MRRAILAAAVLLAAFFAAPASGGDCKAKLTGCGATVVSVPAHFEGAIVVPGSEAANREVARSGGCVGCEWTLVRHCDLNTPQDPGYVNCLAARCPDGDNYRLYLRRPEDPAPVLLDTICLTRTRRIVTAAEIAVDVERHLTRLVPPAHAVLVEQPGWALVRRPAYVTAQGPTGDSTTLDVVTAAGPVRLRIDVGPTAYAWTFGDGGTCTTTSPGGPWDGDRSSAERCDTRVAHVYETAADQVVSVTVTWGGTYTFDVGYGPVGPLAIPGNGVAAPQAQRVVQVREARAQLIGGS